MPISRYPGTSLRGHAEVNDPPGVLITAGPTHEPIDRVRYIGNRSSGRMGLAIAHAAAEFNLRTTLLLGPVEVQSVPVHSHLRIERFRTANDLRNLLRLEWARHQIIFMAAAVSDFRPSAPSREEKIRRGDDHFRLELEPTPDLLAEMSRRKEPDQFVVGFALEPTDRLEASAREKLAAKSLDAIVANPVETLESRSICAMVITADGSVLTPADPGALLPKRVFAAWLIETVVGLWRQRDADRTD